MISIALLGGFRFLMGGQPVTRFASPRVEQLFAYLLLHRGRLLPRDTVAEAFWGEAPQADALASLSTNLYRLRRALTRFPEAGDALKVTSSRVGILDTAVVRLDADEFETEVRVGLDTATPAPLNEQALLKADSLYTGPFLEGTYEDWAVSERERLEALHLQALEQLMLIYAGQRDAKRAIALGRRIIDLDPLRETAHRVLISLHLEQGRRWEAARQYVQFRSTMLSELGIEPSVETNLLWTECLRAWRDSAEDGHAHLDLRVEAALRGVDQVRAELEQLLYELRHHHG